MFQASSSLFVIKKVLIPPLRRRTEARHESMQNINKQRQPQLRMRASSENTVYLRGSRAGSNPGAELVLRDLAVVVSAVEQTERHRVLLPREPARITKSLQARQGVSWSERKREENTSVIIQVKAIPSSQTAPSEMSIFSFDNKNQLQAACIFQIEIMI